MVVSNTSFQKSWMFPRFTIAFSHQTVGTAFNLAILKFSNGFFFSLVVLGII